MRRATNRTVRQSTTRRAVKTSKVEKPFGVQKAYNTLNRQVTVQSVPHGDKFRTRRARFGDGTDVWTLPRSGGSWRKLCTFDGFRKAMKDRKFRTV